ncbi:hypothetical protein SETIT_8G231300v2 [Setaria italica]|uniref:Knottins-like domain-containing protein n=1 Tax=Setaria italica TaxID=4555 RepID=A0A368SB02_SETIT|nr:hypothetical protein SETIT_8G231300v2 [Setaria italica]
MAHSAGKSLSAVLILFVAIAAVAEESASVGGYNLFPCYDTPSANYKGLCIGLIHDKACKRVCLAESSANINGACELFKCWCSTRCTFETVAAASAPIPA